MARKETPDVLGEILAGAVPEPGQPAPAMQPAPVPPARRRSTRKASPRKPKPAESSGQAEAPAPLRWDYLVVSFANYRGWRPRYINGAEIQRWMDAPVIHEYVGELGEDGWELVGASNGKNLYGSSDSYQLYFKRPRH